MILACSTNQRETEMGKWICRILGGCRFYKLVDAKSGKHHDVYRDRCRICGKTVVSYT